VHNSGRDGVLSSRVPTAPEMALQCPGGCTAAGMAAQGQR
jgi:hypothetical protein